MTRETPSATISRIKSRELIEAELAALVSKPVPSDPLAQRLRERQRRDLEGAVNSFMQADWLAARLRGSSAEQDATL